MHRRPISSALLCVAFILWPHPVFGHPNHGPALGERSIKLEISEGKGRVVYGLAYRAPVGRKLRFLADTDHNGSVDHAEAEKRGQVLSKTIAENTTLVAGGRSVSLRWQPLFVAQLEGRIARAPLAVESVATFVFAPSTKVFRLTDSAEFDGIYRTNARIAAKGEVTITKAGRGENPGRVEKRFVFLDLPSEGPAPARVLTALVALPEQPEQPPDESPRALWRWIGGVILVLTCGVVWLLRKRRPGAGSSPG